MARRKKDDDFDLGYSFSEPRIYLIRMLLCVVFVVLVGAILFDPLWLSFQANVVINSVIIGALVLGTLYTFRRVTTLWPEIRWVKEFRRSEPGMSVPSRTALLAPMAAMLREHSGPMRLNTLGLRSILDSIGARLDESRDVSRYMIGLLVFLGLLGTFWGLLDTVTAVGGAIRSLSSEVGPAENMFDDLRLALEGPLAGMGTAFSSSLFGLAGSLVLGFLDLQAAQAQNRFYNDLEEWLSTVTQIGSSGATDSAGDPRVDAIAAQLAEQQRANAELTRAHRDLAEQIDRLVRAVERAG